MMALVLFLLVVILTISVISLNVIYMAYRSVCKYLMEVENERDEYKKLLKK